MGEGEREREGRSERFRVHSRSGVVSGSERSLVHLRRSNRDPCTCSVSFWIVLKDRRSRDFYNQLSGADCRLMVWVNS